jgi:tRNA(fMet)-specific endonuclease VapC
MGKPYLIDTNAAIAYLNNQLPTTTADLIDNDEIKISVITRMELLAWPKATTEQLQILESFVKDATVIDLKEEIIVKGIEIRRQYPIKLPDVIIASTAIVLNYILVSRNTSDFKNIPGLELLNPWDI